MADHFYTTVQNGGTASQFGYEKEGIACYVLETQIAGTSPLYRSYNSKTKDHFYTMSLSGLQNAINKYGYKDEGIACYIFKNPTNDTVPFFRLYSPITGDHFYTRSISGARNAIEKYNYKDEGIVGYVYDSDKNGSIPFFRWHKSGLLSNFTFDSAITAEQRNTLLERHSFAYFQSKNCSNLTISQSESLRNKYKEAIHHGINTDPDANASATIGGNTINVNFTNLFPNGDREIAQTLIHEMMHCAGYSHPDRTSSDKPNDKGPYYSTPPLQAELCIGGVQSDKICIGENGLCVLKK